MITSQTILRQLLTAAGMSPAELARKSGISKGTISNILTGKREASIQMLNDLITASGCKIEIIIKLNQTNNERKFRR